jgi:hypothetical protein
LDLILGIPDDADQRSGLTPYSIPQQFTTTGLDSFWLDLTGSEQGTTTFLLHRNSQIPSPIKWIMTLGSAAFEKPWSFPSGKSRNLGPR